MKNELEKIKCEEIVNHWKDSENEWIKNLPAKSKGSIVEKAFIRFTRKSGRTVSKSVCRDHDCIVDGRKKEVKMSCISIDKKTGEPKTWTFFQVRQFQDYDDIVFICIYPNKIEVFEVDKKSFMNHIHKTMKGIVVVGGAEKKKRLVNEHGQKWMHHNDIFHWMKPINDNWPMGTKTII